MLGSLLPGRKNLIKTEMGRLSITAGAERE